MSTPRYRRPRIKKKAYDLASGSETPRRLLTSSHSMGVSVERTVKRLRLSKAVTIPETTSVLDACRLMAARGIDALLLTDANSLLCGILTDKDIATRVIACELNLQETPVSKVMTRNPVFVLSDALAVEALQKMIQGKFRHVPVVENGDVIGLLEIAKCLYDAIARMEKEAEKGKAIATSEGLERSWLPSAAAQLTGHYTLVEALRERIFRPSLSTIISEHSKLITVSPTETLLTAAQKMQELGCTVVTVMNKPVGILTCKDILTRVIAKDLPINSTLVEKVMTPNPECATLDTSILDSLRLMYEGNFLHLPVMDGDGCLVAIVDVINVTHGAISTIGTGEANSEAANGMMQRFLDSALQYAHIDEVEETRSEDHFKHLTEGFEAARPSPSVHQSHTFSFKFEDRRGIMHRFICDARSLTDVMTCILQRVGDYIDRKNLPQILYEDEEHDKVLLASDSDLAAAIEHARSANWKGLRLYLDYSGSRGRRRTTVSRVQGYAEMEGNVTGYGTAAVAAAAVLVAGLGAAAFYIKRMN
ncbi:hypothetical protein V2J09_006901 [Rumex salicifolius]